MSLQKPEDLQKCSNCSRPMRPRGVLKKEAPGTVAWGHSGQCKSCIQPNTTAARRPHLLVKERVTPMYGDDEYGIDSEDLTGFHEEDPEVRRRRVPEAVRLQNTVSGLEAFMARRHKRVAAEAVSPIVWGRNQDVETAAAA
ncbi:hypothetical protein [Arthrobacter caoxuetaonis]|uniref:Stc1 domain-containing protein n=1 Tax=Arthrobacter caoxuetaonis TaxID=2886935 RepID=A0A9X1SDK7_9MICC|nr:hypothetical protein [Arthrobacter caoxuetaonis]MCC3299770.1 hypothetical protein [Arthrobacter caoxuetaonis]USQ59329.1 hypothetical protein NF551_17245 [Arthrobacter caoxuetaonis]